MEKIRAKLRVKSISFADPITTAAGYKTASWTKQPFTLQDDEVVLTEGDPEEEEIKVHEQDAPIAVMYTGSPLNFSGSFVEPTTEQLKALMGHTESEGFDFARPSGVLTLTKAIKIDTEDGEVVLLPRAEGYVKFHSDFSAKKGRAKFPFKFKALAADKAWPVDVAYPTAG